MLNIFLFPVAFPFPIQYNNVEIICRGGLFMALREGQIYPPKSQAIPVMARESPVSTAWLSLYGIASGERLRRC